MKCKTFKIPLQSETENFEETNFNEFLENIALSQVFASVVNNEFWSIVVFYKDDATTTSFSGKESYLEKSKTSESLQPSKSLAEKSNKIENPPPESLSLTAKQEKVYAALRNWRNEQASQNGLAPYMIAHNDSLMQIAVLEVKSKEDLLPIKGFGEKRVEKYGDEILAILKTVE